MFTSCADLFCSPHLMWMWVFFGLKKGTEHSKSNHLVPLPTPFPILELKKKTEKENWPLTLPISRVAQCLDLTRDMMLEKKVHGGELGEGYIQPVFFKLVLHKTLVGKSVGLH